MKHVYKTLMVIAFIGLTGCVISEPVYVADGSIGHNIDCDAYTTWGACYRKAGEICGNQGYTVLAGGEQKVVGNQNQISNVAIGNNASQEKFMQIKCGQEK